MEEEHKNLKKISLASISTTSRLVLEILWRMTCTHFSSEFRCSRLWSLCWVFACSCMPRSISAESRCSGSARPRRKRSLRAIGSDFTPIQEKQLNIFRNNNNVTKRTFEFRTGIFEKWRRPLVQQILDKLSKIGMFLFFFGWRFSGWNLRKRTPSNIRHSSTAVQFSSSYSATKILVI